MPVLRGCPAAGFCGEQTRLFLGALVLTGVKLKRVRGSVDMNPEQKEQQNHSDSLQSVSRCYSDI